MRRYTSAATMAVLVATFIIGTVVGVRLLLTKAPPLVTTDSPASAGCQPRTIKAGGKLASEAITVNVYNASSISGLANRTLINLGKRGFRAGTVANAPKGVSAVNVSLITKDRAASSARLVAAQFRGKVRFVAPTAALPSGVQVVVGPKYIGLKKKYPRIVTATKATQVCIQMDPAQDS